MKVTYQAELKERKPLTEIAEAATPVLEKAIGPPATRVTAIWGFRVDERGRPLIQLTLQDHSGQVSTEFAPEELQPPETARRRFYWLWGDLLQIASRRNMQSLEKVGADDQDS